MKIKFWGVRGSIPSSLSTDGWVDHFQTLMTSFLKEGNSSAQQIPEFIRQKSIPFVGGFGTATTCVQVSDQNQFLIIDAGSGIKNLNDEFEKTGQIKTQNEYHILMSHFHFDHIMGIPFFAPHFMKGKTIHYYSVQPETEDVVKQMFSRPVFPVTFENLQANIQFHHLKPYEKNQIQGFDVTAFKLDHPDPCYGFRIEKNGKVYAHAIDHESIRTSAQELGPDAGLFKNADLLYFDAQYTEAEMNSKKGWGHGTSHRGFQVASNFGVQQILFAHHDPSANLQALWDFKKSAEVSLKKEFPQLARESFRWDYAYEGQVIDLLKK